MFCGGGDREKNAFDDARIETVHDRTFAQCVDLVSDVHRPIDQQTEEPGIELCISEANPQQVRIHDATFNSFGHKGTTATATHHGNDKVTWSDLASIKFRKLRLIDVLASKREVVRYHMLLAVDLESLLGHELQL